MVYGIYQVYLHHEVLHAVVVRKPDAVLLAEKWGCKMRPIKPEDIRWGTDALA